MRHCSNRDNEYLFHIFTNTLFLCDARCLTLSDIVKYVKIVIDSGYLSRLYSTRINSSYWTLFGT